MRRREPGERIPAACAPTPLVLVLTTLLLATSVPALAQVTALDAWTNQSSFGPGDDAGTVTTSDLIVSVGDSRLLLVGVVVETSGAVTLTTFSATFGGIPLTPVATTASSSQREHAGLWFLLDSQVPAGAAAIAVTYDLAGTAQTVTGLHVKWASYQAVDQGSPIVGSAANNSGSASVTFGSAVNYVSDGLSCYVAGNGSTLAVHGPPSGFSDLPSAVATGDGHSSFAAQTANHSADGSHASGTTVSFSATTSNRSAVAVASLRPISCASSGVLSIATGQTLNGNPIDLTTLDTSSGAVDLFYEVFEGACPVGAGFDQLDDFLGLANGTRPNFGNWTGVPGSDGTLGWVALSGATGSGTTGPASGNPDPYVYLESSATGQTYGVSVTAGSSQYVESNVLDAGAYSLSFSFDWNMNVNDNADASLHLDAWNGAAWDLDVTGGAINTGNNGDVWVTTGPVDLSAYSNSDLKLRVRYVVGNGTIYQNDFAIDNLHFSSASPSSIFSGNATQAQSADTTAWAPGPKCLRLTGDDATCGTPLAPAEETFTWLSVQNGTTAGTATAAPAGCTEIGVTAPYSGDDNADNTLQYRYRTPSGDGAWSSPVSLPHDPSPYGFTLSGLGQGATVDVEVTYLDGDGVTGVNPQTLSGLLVGGACTGAGAASAAQVAGATPSIGVTAPYTYDNDGDNTLSYRFGTSGGGYGAPTVLPHAASPYSFGLSGLVCGQSYDVEVTYQDADGIGAGTAVQTFSGVVVDHCTAAGTASGVVDGCNQITLAAPFAFDANGNGSTDFERGASAGGPWAVACSGVVGPSPRVCVDSGLTASTTYWYRISYVDADAVDGTAQQVLGPFDTGPCNQPEVTPGTSVAVADSCSQITVSAPFVGDTDGDGSTTFDSGPSTTGPWTVACAAIAGSSPRTCPVAGLANASTHYFRVTFVDPDGVLGPSPQVVGPVSTADCRVAPATPSATVDACTQIAVTAPFAEDFDGDSTTTFARGPSGVGPWSDVCVNVSGTSPRNCLDTGASEASDNYYRVTFADPDGVVGANPQTVGPYTTPPCAVNDTTTGTASALVGGCAQITVAAPFVGDDDGDGWIEVRYGLTSPPTTVACASTGGPSPRTCRITGLAPSTAYFVRVTFNDPDGVSGSNPQQLPGTYTTTSCAGNGAPPMILWLTPARNAVLGATDRFKVQVYDPDGVLGANVLWGLDGSAPSFPVSEVVGSDCNLGSQTACKIFSFDVDTTALANGAHSVTVRASDSASPAAVAISPWAFRVSNTGSVATGAGNLLRRTTASQLCADCHSLATHSSQATDFSYGNWAQECLACHTPHDTTNIDLIRGQIETPDSGKRSVDFRNTGGKADFSYATVTAPGQGICETCHTKTRNSDGTPRFRNTGESDGGKHYSSRCTNCHVHKKGFSAGESEGGNDCAGCHPDIWEGMNGAVAKTSRHRIGAVPGVNDSHLDSGITWGPPLSANAAAVRSCLNMCHQDHVHNAPGQTVHDFNVHSRAATAAERAVTRDASGQIVTGTPADTDFSATEPNGGLCISCHLNATDALRPAISKSAYQSSAHNYTSNAFGSWSYTLHDGGVFDRNCTKCHADGDAALGASAIPFGAVHFSDYPSLLTGSVNPSGAPANFVCYRCHGNATTGTDRSGKDIATQIAKARNHPSNNDAVHASAAEQANATFGNTLGVTGRHSSCLDCHDSHQARAGTHATPGNAAGPPLEGTWGAQLSSNPGFWSDTAAGNFTKKTVVAGTDLEATLCFKCHTKYYWGANTPPTSPSGGFAQTDVAKEFNPNNVGNFAGTWASGETAGGFHPVLASAGSNLGAVNMANLVTTSFPWRTSGTRNLMTCTDCHESNSTTDPNGPHGSTAGFILRGPNTGWAATTTMTSSGMPAGTFCSNCHSSTFSNSRFTQHYSRSDHRIACWNCHAAIPHGGPRPGMLAAGAGAATAIGGVIAGWDQTAPYWGGGTSDRLYLSTYPTNNASSWARSNCGCNGTGH